MEKTTQARWGAVSLFLAPLVVLVSFATHPHIGTRVGEPGLNQAIASEIAASPGTWIFSHLFLAVGSSLLALAFVAMRGYLRDAGEESWSAIGLPLVVIGSVLFALLPAMEMAPLAAHEAGVDVAAVQAALDDTVFGPVLLAGSAIFGLGSVAFAVGVHRSRALGRNLGLLVAGALVVVALTRFVPVFWVLFYVQSLALIAAMWPMGYVMWRDPTARPAGRGTRAAAG